MCAEATDNIKDFPGRNRCKPIAVSMAKGSANRAPAVYFSLSRREISLLTRHQGQNGIQRHRLLVLVENLHRPFHHAGSFLLGATLTFNGFPLTGQTHLDGVSRLDRFNKAQVFHAVVGDNRPDAGIDEQPGRGGDQEIAVDHPLAKNRLGGGDFVHVRVEMIAAQAGEVNDIRFGQGSARG